MSLLISMSIGATLGAVAGFTYGYQQLTYLTRYVNPFCTVPIKIYIGTGAVIGGSIACISSIVIKKC